MSAPERVRVRAPATIANLGPGFDVLALALDGPADEVEARRTERPGVTLEEVTGDGGALPRQPERNTAGAAAAAALARRRSPSGEGVALRLCKGIPLGSGLGSSAASAAAAARAVACLFPGQLTDEDLLAAGLSAEVLVSGRHLDNVAASLLGGICVVGGLDPPRATRIEPGFELYLAAVKPGFSLTTRESRAALPEAVEFGAAMANLGNAVRLVDAAHRGDREAFLANMTDRVVEPARAELIAGFRAVQEAARVAGAAAFGISGAGPSVFAAARTRPEAEALAARMVEAWDQVGVEARAFVGCLAAEGARVVG